MKKILFIAPSFFGYWKKIKNELECRGYIVYYINQSLTTQGIVKRYIDRYGNKVSRDRQNIIYYKKMLKQIPENIDFVFVIKGDSLNQDIINEMKDVYSNAIFIMYQWDSVKNSPNAANIAQNFNKVYSFDREDTRKYSWEYRPLFFDSNDCNTTKKDYDISYICTLKFKRAEIYNQIKSISYDKGIKLFSYLFIDLKTYIKRVLFDRDKIYTSIPISELKFKTMTIADTGKVYDRSKIIVDYTTPTQSGLSMRSIECIGHECKLVTNNKNVKYEKFYNENNIYIYDDYVDIPSFFFETPYKKLSDCVYYYYSLKGWVDTIFGGFEYE